MLELCWVACVYGHHTAINVQLPHNRTAPFQLGSVRVLGTFAKTQQANENVLFGIFVRKKRLPATIGAVVPADQLHLVKQYGIIELLLLAIECI